MTRAYAGRMVSLGAAAALIGLVAGNHPLGAQGPAPAHGVKYAQVSVGDLKEWLGYLASDELQGRQAFTEGYGLAASYVADHLRTWRVQPLGDDGTYFAGVKVRGYKVNRQSSVTITSADGSARTFKHGDHVTFGAGPGSKRTLAFTNAEIIGYGQASELNGRDLKGRLVIWMPDLGPNRTVVRGGAGLALNTYGATAAIGLAATPSDPERALADAQEALRRATDSVRQAQVQVQRGRGGRGRGPAVPPDFTSSQNVEATFPPQLTGDDSFFEALFASAPGVLADLKGKAAKGEALPALTLPVKVTIAVDNTFEIVSEQRTRNVVGMIPGTDPALRDTYIVFGAHLDHIGYSETGAGGLPTPTSCRARSEAAQAAVKAAGKVVQNPGRGRGRGAANAAAPGTGARGERSGNAPPPFEQRDLISNGADDDGSGSAALLAIARAFAEGPRPRRSVVFIWHAGEEGGLRGSRYNADFPVVPLERVQAVLNMDMIGRDDCNDLEGDYSNSVFLVGADRISTDLHNVIVRTNALQAPPLTLDYELNDPLDPEGVYTRSDHFSYAAKGVPIVFFTTGLHPDYHKVSDSVDKILFPKMARIAQLVYETGFSIADSPSALRRDNRGPRTGFGSKAEVLPGP